jgi:hypothetical protein
MVKLNTRKLVTVALVPLACLQASCATPIRPDHLAQSDKRSLGRVAIVAARYQPEYQFDAIVAGKGEGAARGALGGVGACAQAGSSGGWVGGLFFIVCAPIGATVGAISGAVAAAPAEQVETAKGSAQRGIEALKLQEITLAAVQRYAKDEGLDLARLPEAMGPAKPGDALSYAEAKDLADTVIEIIVVNAKAETSGSKDLRIGLGMVARVRVLSVRDGKELDTFTIRGGGGLRTLDEWLADDGREIGAAFERSAASIAEQALDEVLLIYHPTAMVQQPASRETERVPPYALRAIEPPLRTKISLNVRRMTYGHLERYQLAGLQPEFRWEAWPRGFDVVPGQVRDIRYDLRILGAGGVAYERRGLTEPAHRLEQPLAPCGTFRWTVRARFPLNDAPRATEWMGAYDTMGGPVAPWWFRRGKGVPALAVVPMSPVPFFPIVETPGANGEECPGR